TCVLDNCVPQCEGRQCGSNGCGGKCGSFDGQCQEGKACDEPTGACRNVSTCDHDRPVCNNCSTQEYCGTDCACHRVRDARPDLVVDRDSLSGNVKIEELNIGAASCTLEEDCVGGAGLRRLLRFEVEAVNQGNATLVVPPPKDRPDLFEFSSCH